MKVAFFPGCVSRGGCPELYPAAVALCEKMGIEPQEMTGAACTGAGVLQESNPLLGDSLNARTFAMAENLGLPIMTICSTCQGVMVQAIQKLKDLEYRAKINDLLSEEGLEYKGTVVVKHLMWMMVEDIGLDKIKLLIERPLTGLNLAPFYGCYLVRPSTALGFKEYPARETYLEQIIELLGANVVDFSGKNRCCGFPILTINEKNSVGMVAKHTSEAKDLGADAMVTPCPLCHLNLDGYQPKAEEQKGKPIHLAIIHLPQLVGLALGLDPKVLGFKRHIISASDILDKMRSPVTS